MVQNITAIQNESHIRKRVEINKRNSFHQAGHAAAIYWNSKQHPLPPVYFRILLNHQENIGDNIGLFLPFNSYCSAKLEGGRLIQALPFSFAEATRYFNPPQREQYRCAFEADIINLLVGALAKAKYAAMEGESNNCAHFIHFNALQPNHALLDIELVNEYLHCYQPQKSDREQKLAELLFVAYALIDNSSNWQAITTLATYISDNLLDKSKEIITCEEAMHVLDSWWVTLN